MNELSYTDIVIISQILCDLKNPSIYGINAIESIQDKITSYLKQSNDYIDSIRFTKS